MKHFIYCTIPGLRQQDLTQMPNLQALVTDGSQQRFTTSFPAVTWPAQASMLTGKLPSEHGVIANGFYWRDKKEVEMSIVDHLLLVFGKCQNCPTKYWNMPASLNSPF